MHEVDEHILDASKQLDCSFVEEKTSIGSWRTEEVMEFLIRSLWLIDSSSKVDLPSCKISPSINAKFSTARKVAERLNNMKVSPGLKLTEQSLLYGEVSEYRRLFLDVIRLYPYLKDAGGEGDEEGEGFLERVRNYKEDMEWTPHYCRNLDMKYKGLFWYPTTGNPELYPFNSNEDPLRKDPRSFAVAVLSQTKGQQAMKPQIRPKPKLAPKPVKADSTKTEDDTKAKEIQQLTEDLQIAQTTYEQLQQEIMQAEWERNRPKTPVIPISDELLAALEDADVQEKLLNFLQLSENKFKKLEKHWETVREEKLAELAEARNLHGRAGRLNKLRRRKEDYLQYEQEADDQKEQADRLLIKLEAKVAEIVNEPGENRDRITKRLFEMMTSLQKQQDELNKVLAENAAIQKEMNWTSQTLYRTFSIIEDALYKIHESYKGGQMYRTFGRINVTCTESMNLIEKNGNILRATEKLTDQLEMEKQKNFSIRLERMMLDLQLIRQENAELEKQIKH